MVQTKVKIVEWTGSAASQYDEIMEDLSERAPEAISIVGNALLDTIENLSTEYNHHPPDRFKRNNKNDFRAAVVFSYRISYLVEMTHVYILRIRHTSREPLNY